MIYGFIPWDDVWDNLFDADFPLPTFGNFYFTEASMLFLVAAVVIGVIAKLGEEGTVTTIVAGASDFLGAALVIVVGPRHHRGDEEHLHHRHRPELDGGRPCRARRAPASPCSPSS